MEEITEQGLLTVLADFDQHGGASMGLVAWELWATEPQLADAWATALAAGWLREAAIDQVYGEQMWRLTTAGWQAHRGLAWRDPAGQREPDLGP